MKVFTFTSSSKVLEGVVVESYTLKNGTEIPVVAVGETGRGRKYSFLPISNAAAEETVLFANVGKTLKGGHKLIAQVGSDSSDECLLVLRTGMGFRGGSSVTVENEAGDGLDPLILAQGMIAQGDAGRMGCSSQYILNLPVDVVLRVNLTGRLYGNPSCYYLRFNGNTLEAVTAEERELVDW